MQVLLSITALSLLILSMTVSGLSIFGLKTSKNVKTLKSELLQLTRKVERGLTETPEERTAIASLFEELERKNPNKNTLKNPALNAIWSLEYTTSDSILGRGGSPRIGPILQKIDAVNLKGENSETVRYLGVLDTPRKVTADFTPLSPSKVTVQFKRFTVGPFSFNAPSSFVGTLDITYLDEELRLSRGDKGNIFVLTKFADL